MIWVLGGFWLPDSGLAYMNIEIYIHMYIHMHVCMHECVSRFPLRGCASGFVSVETTAFIFAGVCERICLSAGGNVFFKQHSVQLYLYFRWGVRAVLCVCTNDDDDDWDDGNNDDDDEPR